jgi:hypothetical protein
MEAAQALAAKTLRNGKTDDERIQFAFRSCLSREPEPDEMEELKSLLAKQKR